jgi:hypothetical protein
MLVRGAGAGGQQMALILGMGHSSFTSLLNRRWSSDTRPAEIQTAGISRPKYQNGIYTCGWSIVHGKRRAKKPRMSTRD